MCGAARRQQKTYTGWQFTEVVADAAGGEVESDDGEPSGSFVMALHHACGLVSMGYLNGLLEIRDRFAATFSIFSIFIYYFLFPF
jgi:hypothetical protein